MGKTAGPDSHANSPLARYMRSYKGPGWSPPPMGFGIGILILGGNLYGGVHKIQISIR